MVAVESPEWLPAGFTVKFKYKKGRKIKYYFNVATGKEYISKKEVIDCATEDNSLLVTPKSKNGDGNGPTSIKIVDVIPEKTNDSAAWLPNGWKVEEKRQKNRNSTYKIYTDLASGSIFYSKVAVIRHLNSIDHADTTTKKKKSDNVVEPLPDVSQQVLPMTNTCSTRAKTRTGNTLVMSDNVVEPLPDVSQQVLPMTNTRSTRAKTRTGNSLVTSDNVVEPLPDVSQQVLPMTNTRSTRAKTRTGNSLVTSDNVVEPLPDVSQQVLPMTNTRSTRAKTRTGNSLVTSDNVVEPLPDVSQQVLPMTNTRSTRAKTKTGNSLVTSDNVVEPLPDVSQQVLPMTNTRSTRAKTRTNNSLVTSDNVVEPLPDVSQQVLPMTNTRSTRAKTRTDNSLVAIANVDEMVPKKSPQAKSMTSTGAERGQKRMENPPVKIDTGIETFPDMSPQAISTTNNDGICENKRKNSTFVTVAIERTTANDLPTGWIKEIRTSQSGVKIRKDPFYIDPDSGYVFRSKPDVLRYLKTKDIRSCIIRPLKRGLDEIKLTDYKIHSSNPANEKLSMNKRQRFNDEESNGGGENSGTKNPAQPKAKILKENGINHNSVKVTAVGAVSLEEKASCENSNENAELGKNPESENNVSKTDPKVMAVDVTISSPITDPTIKQQVPESEGRNKTGSRKSKKRKDPSSPLRASKRLAGSQPEIQSTLNLSERTLRAAVRIITSSEVDVSPSFPHEASKSISQSSNFEPVKDAPDQAVVGEEARQDVNQLKEFEKPPTESSAIPEEPSRDKASEKPPVESSAIPKEPSRDNASEKPPVESSAIPKEPSGEKASEMTLDDGQRSQESQLCYDFGESWSDPLEFALKTLRGEIPIEDTLTFSRSFEEKVDTTFNQQPQFAAPINFQTGLTSHSEPWKKQNAADQLPASSHPLQNAVNPLPASSPPLFSAIGNIGFSSHGGFNYQPSTEVEKKDSKTKFNP